VIETGTRAVLRHTRTSAFKVRPVLDLIRGLPINEARDVLLLTERDAADLVLKVLNSAVANAVHNDEAVADDLYVASAYADEARTFRTYKARARGSAGRIRKRSAHITIVVDRLPEDRIETVRAKRDRLEVERRARRVAASQGRRPRRRGRAEDPAEEVEPEIAAEDLSDELPPTDEEEVTEPAIEKDAEEQVAEEAEERVEPDEERVVETTEDEPTGKQK
jgi:large subunit ribosomal protein L22